MALEQNRIVGYQPGPARSCHLRRRQSGIPPPEGILELIVQGLSPHLQH